MDVPRPWFGRRPIGPTPVATIERPEAEARHAPDLRAAPRARTLLAAKIIIKDGALSPDCVVRDLSAKGARLRIAVDIDLPPLFDLLLIKQGLLLNAVLVWRDGSQLGVQFTGQCDLRTDTEPSRRPIRALWMELARR